MYQLCRHTTQKVMKQNLYQGSFQGKEYKIEYLTFPKLEELSCIKHLFSTRTGGVSSGIYATMNLSFSRGDETEAVRENFRRIAEILDAAPEQIVCSDQTHTTNVRVVTKEDMGSGVTKERNYTDVDGLITKEKGVVLATFYADCVPLYFVDPVKEVIGLSHSGWKGTVNGMGRVTIERMQSDFGCCPGDIHVAIGPSVCRECYEVSSDVAEAFQRVFEANDYLKECGAYEKITSYKNEEQRRLGKCQLDLHLANRYILLSAGVKEEYIYMTDVCTAHNPQYLFSHRKTDGKRGNLGAFLCLK